MSAPWVISGPWEQDIMGCECWQPAPTCFWCSETNQLRLFGQLFVCPNHVQSSA